MSESDSTYSSAEERAIPTIGDDTTSHWWIAALLPCLAVFMMVSVTVADTGGQLGTVLSLVFLGTLVFSSFFTFSAIYIDADKIRKRDLDWYPRWWVYWLLGAILSSLLILWLIGVTGAIASLLMGINFALVPIGIGYVYSRVKHVGLS
ncbi:hypothetical protein [Halococcus sp. IIIV-5B]|uniref:hypothetical protein n=1 Tax=Halococcus sp. IIIV-5B TaxID=2321230 RepID=UPI000E74B2BC|nr:hypothetical protein [Halococcus sp. IIIV-5B]RJT07032.1 hypothetical protein D3261_03145 [Halococcus sp. IIIV-5B]